MGETVISYKFDNIRSKTLSRPDLPVVPRAVNIHITNACNLRCCFCWDHSPLVIPRDKKRRSLPLLVIKKVIADCARMGVKKICLEGGEVMLYRSIKDLCVLIKNSGLKLEVYSNCTFAPSQLSTFIHVDKVRVNLSAATVLSYQRIHGIQDDRCFPRVLKNLYRLTRLRNRLGRPEIQLIFIINEYNFS